jgi:hypothetical protein
MQEMFEESWAYREMVEKGIVQGRLEGRLEDARQMLIRLICRHYPALTSFAKQQASTVNDLEILHNAVDVLFEGMTEEQVGQFLVQITEK